MYPRICLQQSISSGKPQPALWADIEAAMKDPRIQNICDDIKLLDGKDPEEMARLKKQLPIITPHACRFTGDGSRKSSLAVPSGLVMLDIDHIDDPRDFFSSRIFPALSIASAASHSVASHSLAEASHSVAVYFVAITPSGHGIRIIAERKPEESIPDAQKRIADICHVAEYDSVTIDLARASYLMPWSYVLFCEPTGLNFETPEKEAVITTHFAQLEAQFHTSTLPQEKKSQAPKATDFRGIPYKNIVHELVQLLGGEPEQGERNQFYFTLVRYMRYICDFNADLCVSVLPDFGLSLSERHATALSSINRPRKGDLPDLLNRAIIAAEHANSEASSPDSLIASSPYRLIA